MNTRHADQDHRPQHVDDIAPAPAAPAPQSATPSMSGLAPRPAQVAPVLSHYADTPQVVAESGRPSNANLPPLGYMGPIGPYGPLGTLGPIGSNAWNPSNLISGSADWSGLQQQLSKNGGPLSEAGPLGPAGPVGEVNQRDPNLVMPALQAGGDAAVLGPLGPLGALGPLGPLGPVGAHGYKADEDGNYRDDKGKIVRTVDVPYQGGTHTHGLVENYSEAQAKKMKNNDTSFMVSGAITGGEEADSYSFQADHDEFVSVLLVPEKQLDAFDLTITDENNKVLSHTSSPPAIDWVQLRVKAGTKLKAKVKLKASYHMLTSSYRLVVTGSGGYVKG